MTFGNPFEALNLIAPVAELAMTATVQIVSPGSGEWVPYDPDDDSGGYYDSESVIYKGKARVQQATNGNDMPNAETYNPTSQVLMLVQVPLSVAKVERGYTVRVIDGGKDGSLTDYVLVVQSSVNSNWAQVRDIRCVIDVERGAETNGEIS